MVIVVQIMRVQGERCPGISGGLREVTWRWCCSKSRCGVFNQADQVVQPLTCLERQMDCLGWYIG
jgi:hypothetical protein